MYWVACLEFGIRSVCSRVCFLGFRFGLVKAGIVKRNVRGVGKGCSETAQPPDCLRVSLGAFLFRLWKYSFWFFPEGEKKEYLLFLFFWSCHAYLWWSGDSGNQALDNRSIDAFWIVLCNKSSRCKLTSFSNNHTWGLRPLFSFSSWHGSHSLCVSEHIWTWPSSRRKNFCLILSHY